MSKDKRVVSAKDNPFNKFEIGNFKSNLNFVPNKNQTFGCSFCKQNLSDNSITFKGISACPNCLLMWSKLDKDLRQYAQQREVKYGAK